MKPTTLISLSERELALFFPGSLRARLQELLPEAHLINAEPGKHAEWSEALHRIRPEILVTGWHTPLLPDECPGLRYVCHIAGSVRRHVPRSLLERGVAVGNWGETVADTVAEAALGMVLAALRRTQYFGDMMHRDRGWQWAPAGALSLIERRVAIHGFGAVVRHLIPMLKPFRCPVLVYAAGMPDSCFAEHAVQRADSLEQLFDWADVVVEAEALIPANRGCISEPLLRRLRRDGVFVNIARGALVDEAALAKVAAERGLRVALDVYEAEPLAADSPLRGLADAVLFPHVAGPTEDRAHLCGELALANLARFVRGMPIIAPVTLAIYDRSS